MLLSHLQLVLGYFEFGFQSGFLLDEKSLFVLLESRLRELPFELGDSESRLGRFDLGFLDLDLVIDDRLCHGAVESERQQQTARTYELPTQDFDIMIPFPEIAAMRRGTEKMIIRLVVGT